MFTSLLFNTTYKVLNMNEKYDIEICMFFELLSMELSFLLYFYKQIFYYMIKECHK